MTKASELKGAFYELSARTLASLRSGEELSLELSAEDSSFVRFNQGLIRQPGEVQQRSLRLDLAVGQRHASGTVALSGERTLDEERVSALLGLLRDDVPMLPQDPYLHRPDEVCSSEQEGDDGLLPPEEAAEQVLAAARGLDLVGIFASGGMHAGFADSRGQRNWFTSHSFNLDFSLYHRADKAAKASYAGSEWDEAAMRARVEGARGHLAHLGKDPMGIEPGRYRVYLTPAALFEVLDTVGRGGFGLKAQRTRQSPLLKMLDGSARLSPRVSLAENAAEGFGPTFSREGFLKSSQVSLVSEGALGEPLVSSRSAKEYGAHCNGADRAEEWTALHMAAGDLDETEALRALGTGVWVSNLWYLNFSDRKACRLTGMTRFATFWVEGGRIQGPLNVMRFDDTLFRVLGDNLEGLTRQRELLLDPHSYGARSTRSALLPGALVRDLPFTL
jgi:predicted Zn-dependent protease